MGKIARYLNQLIIGNVFDTPDILEAYSSDHSILKIKPKFVALPESTEDVRKLIRFCYQLAGKNIEIPVAVRGSGLDETGADLSNGLVISTEKLNNLLEFDKRERLVRVQSGITLKELNTALSLNGLTVPIGGHDYETIGGLISNCPRDDYSSKYGGISNYVERIEAVLPNGDVLQTGRYSAYAAKKKAKEKTLEGEIIRKLLKLTKDNESLLKNIFKSSHNLAGYPSVARAVRNGSVDLAPLFYGAQGTLGVITEVILRAVPIPKKAKRTVATFESFDMAQRFLEMAEALKPCELNIYDIEIIKTAEETGKKLNVITNKLENGYVVSARFDKRAKRCLKKVSSVKKVLPKSTKLVVESDKTQVALNEFENSLISFLNYTRSGERIPVLTNFYIPPENLQRFIQDLEVVSRSLRMDLSLYGSYSASNYSLRPKFNVESENYSKQVVAFLRAGAYIINRQGGTLAGGTPEGRVKALVTNVSMSESEMNLYTEIKKAFDKYNILNSGAKTGANARFTVSHFRTTGSSKIML